LRVLSCRLGKRTIRTIDPEMVEKCLDGLKGYYCSIEKITTLLSMSDKPKVFIGSSVEGLNIAYAVQQNLTHETEVTVWDQGIFELSLTTIESLILALAKFDFAIFVFSQDDVVRMRQKQHQAVRDNVIFELGLFIGKLGRERSFIITPDKTQLHIPTDLLGINIGKYDPKRSDGSFQSATGPVCHQIKQQVKKLGILNSQQNEMNSTIVEEKIINNEDVEDKDWWALYNEKDYKAAMKSIDEEIKAPKKETNPVDLKIWRIYIQYMLDSSTGYKQMLDFIKAEPESILPYNACAKILIWESDLILANKILDQGFKKFPNNENLLIRKSEVLEKLGKVTDAIQLLSETKPTTAAKISLRVIELYELSDKFKAYELALKLYEKNPLLEDVIYKVARLAQETNHDKVGLFLFNKLISIKPKNETYWAYFGNSCINCELNSKAYNSYKKAEELSGGKEAWILSNIGNLLKRQDLLVDARSYLLRALELDKDSEYILSRLAGIVKDEQAEEKKFNDLLQEGISELSAIDQMKDG
jgi:predicted nucleotide-binding protein/tetratricopeptide (TPR) repeat protein